jgi:hypothetical protein
VEPDEGDVGEDRCLDNGGDEKSEASGAIRGEETGEKEAQGDERRQVWRREGASAVRAAT